MTTLTEFLLARIAEDEAVARAATPVGESRTFYATFGAGSDDWGCYYFNVLPTRILAECAAKRAVVDACRQPASCLLDDDPDDPGEWNGEVHLAAATLRALAAVYADHPDYRAEWAVV